MYKKRNKIINSNILLKITSPSKRGDRLFRIIMVIVLVLFAATIVFSAMRVRFQSNFVFFYFIFSCILILGLSSFVFYWLSKRKYFIFTEVGVTDGSMGFSALWEDIEFYNFQVWPSFKKDNPKYTLMLSSNKPPLYHVRYMALPKSLAARGLYFSAVDVAMAERIFKEKGVPKEKWNC
jgi:hypothetical protein